MKSAVYLAVVFLATLIPASRKTSFVDAARQIRKKNIGATRRDGGHSGAAE